MISEYFSGPFPEISLENGDELRSIVNNHRNVFDKKKEKSSVIFQILHVVFSLLAIISWFDELYYFALNINFSFVQQNTIRQDFTSHWLFMLVAVFSSTYVVYIIVLALGYLAVLILPSITLTLATMALCRRRELIQVDKFSERKLYPRGKKYTYR